MRDRVESSGLWRFVGVRRAEVRGQFPCRRGILGVPSMYGCSFPGSEAGRGLGLDDSVPSGIIMQDRVESPGLWAGLLGCGGRCSFRRDDSGVPRM